jgi:hypothetical protein
VPSHHDLFLAVFITNISEFDFSMSDKVLGTHRLWKTAEVDHRVPLFRVWREHRQTAWPALLNFWGLPNLQVINRDAHRVKCAAEARSRGQNAAQVSPVRSATDLDGRATRPT